MARAHDPPCQVQDHPLLAPNFEARYYVHNVHRNRPMRVMVITRVFPNALEPLSSPFNRQQLRALATRCDIEVVNPIPYFPGAGWFQRQSRAGRLRSVEPVARIDGMLTYHPRALYLPIVGVPLAVPLFYGSALRPWARRQKRHDLILASWLYPDACAALWLARQLGVPCVVKAHGTDVNDLAARPYVAPIVRALLPRADAAVVAEPPARRCARQTRARRRAHARLAERRRSAHFPPRVARSEARVRLGISATDRVVLFVGRLDAQKGIRELIRAHRGLPATRLVLLGDGAERAHVRAAAAASHGASWRPARSRFPRWRSGWPLQT